MNNWTKSMIRDLVKLNVIEPPMDGNHGETHPKGKDFIEFGIPFIMASNLNNSRINFESCKYISEIQASKLRKGFSIEGDVLLTHKASIGRTAIVPEIDTEYIMLTPQVTYYRIKNKKVLNNTFLKYYFDFQPFQDLLALWSGAGSTRAYLGITGQKNLSISYPNIATQKQIAKILSDLDAKIELNNKINTELEAMAKLIYDYWFVQFDFPDKNGKPYKYSGGKMVYNEELKREIPDGWEVGTLLEIANFQNGLACQKYRPINSDFLRVIKIKDMKEGFSAKTEKVRPDVPDKIKIFNGDILFSWSASLEVIQWSGGKGALNQHIFKVTSEKYPKSYYYFELLNYLQHFKMMAELRKTTMGHITQEHLKQSRIVIPAEKKINQLNRVINPILEKVNIKKIENQKLAELRDWLLPMLMNGQVRVN